MSESMLLTQEIKKQSELMDLITKKNKGLTFFKSKQELGKIKENLTQALSINSKKSESFMHLRPNLVWDKIVTTAILDRVLHHSHIINIQGDSYRLKEKKQTGVLHSEI